MWRCVPSACLKVFFSFSLICSSVCIHCSHVSMPCKLWWGVGRGGWAYSIWGQLGLFWRLVIFIIIISSLQSCTGSVCTSVACTSKPRTILKSLWLPLSSSGLSFANIFFLDEVSLRKIKQPMHGQGLPWQNSWTFLANSRSYNYLLSVYVSISRSEIHQGTGASFKILTNR